MANDRMKVIAVMTRKGGAGKTTLVRALVSAILSNRMSCLAIDADPQQALVRWGTRLTDIERKLKVVAMSHTSQLEHEIDAVYERGDTDFVLVDTQGAGGVWADEIAIHCDHIVMPVMLSPTDFEIAMDTYRWYHGLHRRASDASALPSFAVLVSRFPNKLTLEHRRVLQDIANELPLIGTMFLERNQHANADRAGLLHEIADKKRQDENPLVRRHASYFDDAVYEARDILNDILRSTNGTKA